MVGGGFNNFYVIHNALLKPLFTVLSMCTHPLNPDNTVLVTYLNHQAVVITLDIKYDPVVVEKVGTAVAVFNVLWCFPVGRPGLMKPGVQRTFDVGMLFGKLGQEVSSQNVHSDPSCSIMAKVTKMVKLIKSIKLPK